MITDRRSKPKPQFLPRLGYVFLALLLLLGYSYLLLLLIIILSSSATLSHPVILMTTVTAVAVTILAYTKISPLYNRFTTKVLFKNSLQLPVFLNELSQALITSSDVKELSQTIIDVLEAYLQPTHTVLIVKNNNFRITADSDKKTTTRKAPRKLSQELIKYRFKEKERVATYWGLDDKYLELKSLMSKQNMPIALDLTGTSRQSATLKEALNGKHYATLLLGPKRNRKAYTKNDIEALRIVSKELVIALQNSLRFEEIKSFNDKLQIKIDEATHKLKYQNKKLLEADSLKDDFLSIASHQMRTPISTINGYISLLHSGDAGKLSPQQDKFTNTIQNSTRRLSYLINDFLTISRLKSGKFKIDKSQTNLVSVVENEVESSEVQFKNKKVELKLKLDSKIPSINLDEQKMRQIIANFIDNALHYTEPGGKVQISLSKVKNEIIFKVSDTGIGVPKEDQHKLFSKMFRASNAETIRPDGNGLGLYLAKKVILGHGGHIILKSEEGKGSEFGFSIPSR